MITVSASNRHSGMRRLAQARNPYSLSWLWIPGSRFARPGMTKNYFPALAIFSIRRASTAQ